MCVWWVGVGGTDVKLVYSSATQKQLRQFTRFKDIAYSGSFRDDGKLLVAGGQDSIVQVASLLLHPCPVEHASCAHQGQYFESPCCCKAR